MLSVSLWLRWCEQDDCTWHIRGLCVFAHAKFDNVIFQRLKIRLPRVCEHMQFKAIEMEKQHFPSFLTMKYMRTQYVQLLFLWMAGMAGYAHTRYGARYGVVFACITRTMLTKLKKINISQAHSFLCNVSWRRMAAKMWNEKIRSSLYIQFIRCRSVLHTIFVSAILWMHAIELNSRFFIHGNLIMIAKGDTESSCAHLWTNEKPST